MDEKLRQICDATKMFGRKEVLPSDDLLQIKDFGTAILNSICVTVTTCDVNCRRLTSEFDVFTLKRK